MKYTSEITINLPREQVISLFDNQDNMFKWMEGLKKITPLTKQQGEIGSRMEMYFETGKRKLHIVETILEKNLPSNMSFKYNSIGMENIVHISFSPIEGNKTKYQTESIYKFKGIFKLMSFFASKMIKKQSYKHLVDFKQFAENQK